MPPRRRRAAPKRSASRATPKAAPIKPVVGPDERLFVLSVPFELRNDATANGARWDPYYRQNIYVGTTLRYGLAPYAAPDYSWERWVEDDINNSMLAPAPSTITMTPRPHQVEAINKIVDSAKKGWRGFLEADDVGVGKTIASWVGAIGVSRQRGGSKILVVCPKGVIPHWRRTIAAVGDDGNRVVVINYEQAKKLLSVPESATAATRTRTKNKRIANSGQPLVDWDVVLIDESHKCKNQESQRTRAVARIARYAQAAKAAPYVIWMSATAGQNPTELGYLAPLLAQITGASRSALSDFGQWLADEGFAVTYNARFKKWDWGVAPDDATPSQLAELERRKAEDLERIHSLLFADPSAPSIRRLPTDIAGWPEIQRIPYPVELDFAQRNLYEQAWTEFRSQMRLHGHGKNPAGSMVARLRFRQKASLIRVPGTVEHVLNLLENGHQVAVSVFFHESLEAIRDQLEAAGVTVAEYSGANSADREDERFKFQRGQARVILYTVAEAISLHQKEPLPDGSHATDVPRDNVVHDPRYSGLESIQIEGRTHRDGQAANVYYCFAVKSVEEAMVRTLVSRVLSTKAMAGDDVTSVRVLEAVLDAGALDEDGTGTGSTPSAPAAPRKTTPPPRPRTASPASVTTSAPARSSKTPKAAQPPKAASKTAPGSTRVTRPPQTRPPGQQPGKAAVPPGMTPEEFTLRQALSGGKPARTKRAETPEQRAAFERRLREG